MADVPGYNIRLGLDYKILAPLFRKIWSQAAAVIANSKGLQKNAKKLGLSVCAYSIKRPKPSLSPQ